MGHKSRGRLMALAIVSELGVLGITLRVDVHSHLHVFRHQRCERFGFHRQSSYPRRLSGYGSSRAKRRPTMVENLRSCRKNCFGGFHWSWFLRCGRSCRRRIECYEHIHCFSSAPNCGQSCHRPDGRFEHSCFFSREPYSDRNFRRPLSMWRPLHCARSCSRALNRRRSWQNSLQISGTLRQRTNERQPESHRRIQQPVRIESRTHQPYSRRDPPRLLVNRGSWRCTRP